MELKNEVKKASPFGRGGGEADGEGETALSPAIAGALPEGEPCVMRSFMGVDFVGYILFRKNVTLWSR